MKKEEPKKDKKTRKTSRKESAADSKTHKAKNDALFSESEGLNSNEQSPGKNEVEESVENELNGKETPVIPEQAGTDEKNVEPEVQEEIQNVQDNVISDAKHEETPEITDDAVNSEEEQQMLPEETNLSETTARGEDIQSGEDIQAKEEFTDKKKKPEIVFPKSNYQISLINENLLRIVVETDKPVGVDCFIKNRKPEEGDSKQTQSNRILVHPKEEGKLQEVEIIVSIDKSEGVKIVDADNIVDEEPRKTSAALDEESKEKKPKKFLIDPSVADILQKPVPDEIMEKYKPMTREEYFEEKLKPSKNKYAINRALVEKHLKIGIVTSIILLIFSMIVYAGITSDNESGDEQKPQRLIVIQDIPEMKVDIPLEEKKDEAGEDKTDITPKINIRRNPIRTPRIEISKKDTTAKTDSTDIAKNNEELDKLRRGDTTGTGTSVSGINSTDTVNANAVSLPFGKYGWVLIDSLDYGGRKFKFSSDTSQVIKDPSEVGKVSDFKMFVIQDIKGTEFSCGKNLRDFPVLVTEYKAYKCEPRDELLSNQIEYMYRIINQDNTYAITIKVEYKKEYKPEYYPKVDTLISQIRLPQFVKTEN